jgi:hypothetical protein
MGNPAIVIVSRDRDFSAALAEQVKKELSLVCEMTEKLERAQGAALVITTENGEYACPVITVDHPPVRMLSLLEEIEAALARGNEMISLPRGIVVQLRVKQLVHEGKSAALTEKEVQLLQSLAQAGAKGVTREQLLKEVWGIDAALDTHTLETHIYRLRGKIRELVGDDIITAQDGGYALAK